MICTDRFALQPTQTQRTLQPQCPVYVHCSRRCIERNSGTPFVQIRMVNRSDRLICSVFLCIEGLRADGSVAYILPEVVLADCNALPHSIFGEERLILLERQTVERLQITVVRVAFADGMLWRRLPGQRLTTASEAGWTACPCSMLNPPQAGSCALCGRPIEETVPPGDGGITREAREVDSLPTAPPCPFEPKPAPILRHFEPALPVQEPPRRRTAFFIFLAVLILLCLLGTGYLCMNR